ncbi:hypothetical protein JW935_00015 [candidate division KSB1 bacterium]|nr:hypothetical protein [candidate division KSB1 bacterium]
MKNLNLSIIFISFFLSNICVYSSTTHKSLESLDHQLLHLLESKGFTVHRMIDDSKDISRLDSAKVEENKGNIIKLTASRLIPDARKRAIRPAKTSLGEIFKTTNSEYDTIMTEDFETGAIDTNKWELIGNPTWGITDYKQNTGLYSIWCAAGGDSARNPDQSGYVNNMESQIIFGPFNLGDATHCLMKFYFYLESEMTSDWFYFGASNDGENFGQMLYSGHSNGWREDLLNIGNVPELGDLTGSDSVWVIFGFVSDSTGLDKGVYVDDIKLYKGSGFSALGGWYNGIITKDKSPYVAVWDIYRRIP